MDSRINVSLSHDEALILSGLLSRLVSELAKPDGSIDKVSVDEAEKAVLYSLETSMERGLSEIFDINFYQLVEAAKQRM